MTEPRRDEKEEKDEKGRDESWDEKWRNDPVNAAVWALVLIWAGLVWLADSMGYFSSILGDVEIWPFVFLGAGLIMFLGVLARLVIPAWRRPIAGSLILAVVFVGIGLGQLTNWLVIGPLILLGIGVALLFSGLFRRRE